MKKPFPLLLVLTALPTALYAAPADDAARISALERRIADLEARIAVLEHNQATRNGNVREVIIEHRAGRSPASPAPKSVAPARPNKTRFSAWMQILNAAVMIDLGK